MAVAASKRYKLVIFKEIMNKRRKYDTFVVDLLHLLGYADFVYVSSQEILVMKSKLRLTALIAILIASASFALAGPGFPPPMPPGVPPMLAGPGFPPPMPPGVPPMMAGPGFPPPMPPGVPPMMAGPGFPPPMPPGVPPMSV